MTQGQFKSLNEKKDTILESTKSSSNFVYMLKSHQDNVKTLINDNARMLAASTKAVEASMKTVQETTEKVKKLLTAVTKFMVDFRTSSNQNTEVPTKLSQVSKPFYRLKKKLFLMFVPTSELIMSR